MTTATSTAAVLMTQLCKNRTVFWVWGLILKRTQDAAPAAEKQGTILLASRADSRQIFPRA
jgi:hypothetical protein